MAASDYAQICWNQFGENIQNCEYKFSNGLSFEAYKNWIYIRNKTIWTKKSGFDYPTIGQINVGEIRILNIHINVKVIDLKNKKRIPYNPITIFSIRGDSHNFFGGICCCAFYDWTKYFAQKQKIDVGKYILSEIHNHNHGIETITIECSPKSNKVTDINNEKQWDNYNRRIKKFNIPKIFFKRFGLSSYCGITSDMIKAYLSFLRDDCGELVVAQKIEEKNNLKYSNQGNRCYVDINSNCNVDNPETPVFHKIVW